MKIDCSVVRDLLPLYADDVCSDASRQIVDEHLKDCADCAAELKRLKASEIESGLQDERNEVIRYQAKRFRNRSAAVGSVIAGIFAVPILVCLIVNLASGAALDWFLIVLSALAVAGSLIIVPLIAPQDKLFWMFCAFCVSLMILLEVCCEYSGGDWFFTAASASLFGLAVVFLPFVIRAKPVQKWIGGCHKGLLVVAVDVILFTNMMNMISLRTKGLVSTLTIALLCLAGIGLIVKVIKEKRGNQP